MKIKILKENFPNDMPTGPSLGRIDVSDIPSSMPERQRKLMTLIEIVGKKLDELQLYDKAYARLFSSMFKDLEPRPKTRVNQYGEHFYIRGPDGEIVHETLDETAAHVAKKSLQGRTGTNSKTFKKYYEKTISQATQVAEIFEEINQYLVLIETLELDRKLALHARKHIFKNRKIEFPDANRSLRLNDYGDYIAATGLAIKHYSKIIEGFANPNLGEYIRTGALSFSENFNALSEMMTEVLMSSGDLLKTRHDFVDAMVPELLKHMMKIGQPVSIYDLRNHGFFEEMREKFPVGGRGQIDGLGGAKVMIRKALKTLVDKGYVVQDDPNKHPRNMSTLYEINPQMAQQAGQEYFPKPEGIMEHKKIKTRVLKEATGEQKRQQKRDAYASREKQRRKIKTRIKRSQNKGESPYKSERPDFDPINDLGKAMKKRYKDLEVRANGEEIED